MLKATTRLLKLISVSIPMALSGGVQLASALEVGDKVPDFSLQASDGKSYTLSEFQGKKPVVLAFFPKAFTGG